ncbi:hypothetical protein [Pseudoalteromonas luteoviolacea]|uniref:hypothetical protein n=1 Tax=Pseudoalteromonas luteoviolacea TaxID=43657 RepID=UPI00159F0397|nr:hypothetical protein [Pseudoalteromonas luteoviolacea]
MTEPLESLQFIMTQNAEITLLNPYTGTTEFAPLHLMSLNPERVIQYTNVSQNSILHRK